MPPPACQALLNIVGDDLPRFDNVNMATAVHQLGSCRLQPHQLNAVKARAEFRQLLGAVCECCCWAAAGLADT
jgi:hypothetical protein